MIAWTATVLCLATYGLSVRLCRPRIFHWGNVPASLVLAVSAASAGIWANAALSAAFGLIGAWALIRR